MNYTIQPEYKTMKAQCSCGNIVETESTLAKDIKIEVCSACHPYYTGKMKILDTAGRVEKFNSRYRARKLSTAKDSASAEDAK